MMNSIVLMDLSGFAYIIEAVVYLSPITLDQKQPVNMNLPNG